jgi:hypothetical protein
VSYMRIAMRMTTNSSQKVIRCSAYSDVWMCYFNNTINLRKAIKLTWHTPRLCVELPTHPSTQGHLTVTFQFCLWLYIAYGSWPRCQFLNLSSR